MKRIQLIVVAILLSSISLFGQDSNPQPDKKTSGTIFWGLHKWGDRSKESKESKKPERFTHIQVDIKAAENDSVEVKSIMWGAVQWTEKKKKKGDKNEQ